MAEFPLEDLLGRTLEDDLTARFFREFDGLCKVTKDGKDRDITVDPRGSALRYGHRAGRLVILWYLSARYNAHDRIRKARPYEGRLPIDLTFAIRHDEAQELLGEPLVSGDARDRNLRLGPWLKYPSGANEVHLAFDFEDRSLFNASVILGGFDHRTGLVSGPGPGPAG